jgi:Bacterial regulatory helix-turn-helix protein, lysR family
VCIAITLRQLEYFVTVVDQGSFTAAAALLHVTQPGLSHQIQALERELGGPLLERLPRNVRLTPAGRTALPHARASAVFVPAISTATSGVGPRDAGVASATANTSQQIGASLGVALLNTIAASATASYLVQHPSGSAARAEGLVHGYAVAAACATAIFLVAALQAGLLITTGRPQHGHASAEHTTS